MKKKIKDILKNILKLSEIDDQYSRLNNPTWDSMAHLNLIIEIENTYNISFSPEEILRMNNLTEIENILQKKLNTND